MKKKDSDLTGWHNLRRILNDLDGMGFETGFFEEDQYGPENDTLSVAQVATWQEFGTYDGGLIPERPFMRVGLVGKMKSKDFERKQAFAVKRILSKKETPISAVSKLGKVSADYLFAQIVTWNTPPNAESTVEQKGFDDPLIETQTMLDSAKYKMTGI